VKDKSGSSIHGQTALIAKSEGGEEGKTMKISSLDDRNSVEMTQRSEMA
jgi:hypothetical protein